MHQLHPTSKLSTADTLRRGRCLAWPDRSQRKEHGDQSAFGVGGDIALAKIAPIPFTKPLTPS